MLTCALALWWVVDDGHDWRGDFGMYVSQGQALLDGTINELYEQNKLTMQLSETQLGPFLYPMGFPLLLVPILKFFGLNFYMLKAVCCVALVLSIPLLYRLFRPGFTTAPIPLLGLTSVAFYHGLITFGDSILSDLPFLFFSLLSLVLIEKRTSSSLQQVMLGVVIYFTYSIRDVGIFLLPTLAVYQWHQSKFDTKRTNWILVTTPYSVFLALFIVFKLLLPLGQENHFAMLGDSMNMDSVRIGFNYYSELLRGFLFTESNLVLLGFIFLAGIGIIISLFDRPHLVIFLLLNASILLVWPYKQGFRLLFPVIPFLVFYCLIGLNSLLSFQRKRKWIAPSVIALVVAVFSVQNFRLIKEYAARDTNQCYTPELQEMYGFMRENLPKDALVAHYYPRVTRMFTGINAARIGQYEFDLGSDAQFYQNGRTYTDKNVIAKYPILFETKNEILLGKKTLITLPRE